MEVVETIKEESRDIFLRLQLSKLSRELVVVETESRRDWSSVSLVPGRFLDVMLQTNVLIWMHVGTETKDPIR
jgi:hypothetical protein